MTVHAAVSALLASGELDPARFNFTKPSCQVILSLREDFLPDLEGLKQQMPALAHNRLRLKKLSGTQALDIVTRPALHLLAVLDPTEPYPVDQLGRPRGRQGRARRVVLPDGWLQSRELVEPLDPAAEDATSGG